MFPLLQEKMHNMKSLLLLGKSNLVKAAVLFKELYRPLVVKNKKCNLLATGHETTFSDYLAIEFWF